MLKKNYKNDRYLQTSIILLGKATVNYKESPTHTKFLNIKI